MKKSMIMGSNFARQMGDMNSAISYDNTMLAINNTIYNNHFTGNFVEECQARTIDSAVIVGFNDGFDNIDSMFSPTSYEVALTISQYNNLFCNEYQINIDDTNAGIPGVLYGRYQGDTYAGGNPWVLSTAALASLFYRGASYIKQYGLPSQQALDQWNIAFNLAGHMKLSRNQDTSTMADLFASQGDGVMLRLRSHVIERDFHLDEQIDRNTGIYLLFFYLLIYLSTI
jgi:glucoamylase